MIATSSHIQIMFLPFPLVGQIQWDPMTQTHLLTHNRVLNFGVGMGMKRRSFQHNKSSASQRKQYFLDSVTELPGRQIERNVVGWYTLSSQQDHCIEICKRVSQALTLNCYVCAV